jgi:hypothetical protein
LCFQPTPFQKENEMNEDTNSEDPVQSKTNDVVVPEDYPRDPHPSALSGAQRKFSARLIDGRFVVGLTEEERRERYVFCADWVEQLVSYVSKAQSKKPELSIEGVLDYIHGGIRQERGDLGELELDWIMKKLRARVLPTGE